MEKFELIETLTGHTSHIFSLITWNTPGHDYLISGSSDKTIKIWKLSNLNNLQEGTFECIKTLIGHTNFISSLCIWSGPSQDYLISGSWDKTIKIWNLSMTQGNGECIKTLTGHSGYISNLFTWSGSQDYLISGSRDKTIKIWGDSILYHFKKEDSKLKSVYSDISKDTELRLTETCLRCFLLEESDINCQV